jgi:AcrR family transcriptional regulator
VSQVGYSQATIREIARMANVTSASLYNYFPNKSELIQATIAARADAAMPRLRAAAEGPGDIVDRIEAVLDECGNLMRQYPDLAAFEWAIRAEHVIHPADRLATGEAGPDGDASFETFREIIEGLVDEARRRGELGEPADPRGAVEAIYALIYGLTELAATLPAEEYFAALSSAKVMVRGALFGPA